MATFFSKKNILKKEKKVDSVRTHISFFASENNAK
jgi:hypothetical protein